MPYRSFKLPHLHPVGATYSILLCVADAVPRSMLKKLNDERIGIIASIKQSKREGWQLAVTKTQLEYDRRFDALLNKQANQTHPFSDPGAAQIMVDRLKQFDKQFYDLYAYSVMSNHVHAELDFSIQLPKNYQPSTDLPNYTPLDKVIQLIKGGSAFYINKYLGNTGTSLWTKRYRDRFIRGESHLLSACRYTRKNPEVAGIVIDAKDHPFTGGMAYNEIAIRQERRIYPNPGDWYDRLEEYDDEKPARLYDWNPSRSHGL